MRLRGLPRKARARAQGQESKDKCGKRTTIDRFHNVLLQSFLPAKFLTRVAPPGTADREGIEGEEEIK